MKPTLGSATDRCLIWAKRAFYATLILGALYLLPLWSAKQIPILTIEKAQADQHFAKSVSVYEQTFHKSYVPITSVQCKRVKGSKIAQPWEKANCAIREQSQFGVTITLLEFPAKLYTSNMQLFSVLRILVLASLASMLCFLAAAVVFRFKQA